MYSFFLTLRYRNVYKTIMFQSGLEMLSRNYSRQIFSLPHTKNCKMFKLIPEWTALFSQHCYRLPIPSSLFLLSIKNLCSSKIRKRILLIFMSVQMTHTHEQTSKRVTGTFVSNDNNISQKKFYSFLVKYFRGSQFSSTLHHPIHKWLMITLKLFTISFILNTLLERESFCQVNDW